MFRTLLVVGDEFGNRADSTVGVTKADVPYVATANAIADANVYNSRHQNLSLRFWGVYFLDSSRLKQDCRWNCKEFFLRGSECGKVP